MQRNGMKEDYVSAVAESVEREYTNFKTAELQKSKEEIYDDNYKIRFYIEMYEYFTANKENSFLNVNLCKCLINDSPNIISELYDYYLSNEYASITTWEDINEMIYDYNKEYYKDILEGGTEFE